MSNDNDIAKQDAREHRQEVLTTHREQLEILLAQQAQLGSYTPPHILNDIRDTQEALRPIKAWLRTTGIPVNAVACIQRNRNRAFRGIHHNFASIYSS